MKIPVPKAMLFAVACLAGCAVVPVDEGYYYYSSPPAFGYYGPPATSHVWIGGTWSGHQHHHPPNWSPGHHSHWNGPGPGHRHQWGNHQWNQGGGHRGHWHGGGGRWRGHR